MFDSAACHVLIFSLYLMVAGIAHEINNPVNFIYANIEHASNYICITASNSNSAPNRIGSVHGSLVSAMM